jgi:hypothetical protein
MVQLAIQIEKYVGRTIDFTKEVIIVDGTITEWNIKDKIKPTTTQLDAVKSDAETEESNLIQIQKRIIEYGTVQEQLEYIVENGIDKFITKQKAVKDKYKKA